MRAARSDGFVSEKCDQNFSIDEKIAIGLICEFLQRRNMDLTLSVFLPACGYGTPGECLNSKDLASIVGMENSEDIFGNLIRKSRRKTTQTEIRQISTQTEDSRKLGLEERLQMIDQGKV